IRRCPIAPCAMVTSSSATRTVSGRTNVQWDEKNAQAGTGGWGARLGFKWAGPAGGGKAVPVHRWNNSKNAKPWFQGVQNYSNLPLEIEDGIPICGGASADTFVLPGP